MHHSFSRKIWILGFIWLTSSVNVCRYIPSKLLTIMTECINHNYKFFIKMHIIVVTTWKYMFALIQFPEQNKTVTLLLFLGWCLWWTGTARPSIHLLRLHFEVTWYVNQEMSTFCRTDVGQYISRCILYVCKWNSLRACGEF